MATAHDAVMAIPQAMATSYECTTESTKGMALPRPRNNTQRKNGTRGRASRSASRAKSTLARKAQAQNYAAIS